MNQWFGCHCLTGFSTDRRRRQYPNEERAHSPSFLHQQVCQSSEWSSADCGRIWLVARQTPRQVSLFTVLSFSSGMLLSAWLLRAAEEVEKILQSVTFWHLTHINLSLMFELVQKYVLYIWGMWSGNAVRYVFVTPRKHTWQLLHPYLVSVSLDKLQEVLLCLYLFTLLTELTQSDSSRLPGLSGLTSFNNQVVVIQSLFSLFFTSYIIRHLHLFVQG